MGVNTLASHCAGFARKRKDLNFKPLVDRDLENLLLDVKRHTDPRPLVGAKHFVYRSLAVPTHPFGVIRRVVHLLTFLFALAIASSAASAQSFTTIDVPGAIQTQAQGINAAGQIVGAYQDSNSSVPWVSARPWRHLHN